MVNMETSCLHCVESPFTMPCALSEKTHSFFFSFSHISIWLLLILHTHIFTVSYRMHKERVRKKNKHHNLKVCVTKGACERETHM